MHFTFQGFYIYTEASFISTGTEYVLASPIVFSSTRFCLNFWYNRNGATIGPLHIRDYSKTLRSIYGNSGNVWIEGQIDLPAGFHQVKYYIISSFKFGKLFSMLNTF